MASVYAYAAKSLYRKISAHTYNRFAEHKFRKIRRGRRDRCWCGGELLPFKWHASYGVCANCGCYVNRIPPLPGQLKSLYSFGLYWHTRQRLKCHPTIECRSLNDWSDGRMDYWLNLIEHYGPSDGRVVEVGCAHGVLIAELEARGYKCVGVEPDERTAEWVIRNMGVDVRPGFFPCVDLPNCDLFLALDVFEHTPDPEAFMKATAKLLNPGGVAVIQTPIDRYDYAPPFSNMFYEVFDDLEHFYIFTAGALHQLCKIVGLVTTAEKKMSLGHEIVVLKKDTLHHD